MFSSVRNPLDCARPSPSALVGVLLAVAIVSPARAAKPAPRKPAAPNAAGPRVLEVRIQPASVLLEGPRSEQALLATARLSDGSERDVTSTVKWSLERSGIAALDAESLALRPGREGETTLSATLDGRTARASVRVTGTSSPRPVSFVNDVMPVLTRTGCNQASCHGAQSGKGGFKLSLFGYDPAADYRALAEPSAPDTKARIDRSAPDESLLLRKATLAVSHGGGKRVAPGTLSYRVLRDWIAGGAPVPNTAVQLKRLEVTPAERTFFQTGQPQRLLVRGFYEDGSERDVTALARYDAQDPEAAEVTDQGIVTPVKRGATAVMVRYGGQVGTFQAQVPFSREPQKYPAPANLIDEKVFARLGQLGLPLSAPASDLEFLRRVSLDLTGTLPTPDETRRFLAECGKERHARGGMGLWVDGCMGEKGPSSNAATPTHPHTHTPIQAGQNVSAPKARAALVEELLTRPEYVYFWTQKWCDLLKVNSRDLGQDGMLAYYRYLAEAVSANRPWNRLARDLVLASPTSGPEGSYYRTAITPEDRAMSTAEVFLGVRIQCAQCHQHPFEAWSQDEFWQFAAFFAKVPVPVQFQAQRLSPKAGLQPPAPPPPTEVINPRTKQPAFPPKPLGAAPVPDPDSRGDRREHLAAWLTSPENPWFARAFVNRVWKHFFGRGIVDPVDDLRVTNPASDPQLLDALAREFAAKNHDVRALLRLICTSRAYQTTSRPLPGNKDDTRFFSHAYFRRLTAEQLADAIAQATGIPDDYPGYQPGLRAIQLPDPQIAAPFLDAFGRPGRTQACECERTNDSSIAQALRLITGPGLSNKATAGNGRIARLMFYTQKSPDEIWEELYLWSLNRPPTAAERQAWREHLESRFKAAPDNRLGVTQEALEDWFWALLNSKEFLFNH